MSWVRCGRRGAWVDELDVPLDAAFERYRVTLRGPDAAMTREAESPTITISAQDLRILGPGEALVEVRQVGDSGVSRPAVLAIPRS